MFRRLFNWYGKHIGDLYASRVKQSLSNDEWNELVELARRGYQSDPTFRLITQRSATSSKIGTASMLLGAEPKSVWGGPEFEAILTPERVLANPLLTPYRRTAFRFLPTGQRETLSLTPILVTPRFNFNAYANKFKVSGKRFIQLPFGVIFALRCVAEVALVLYTTPKFQTPRQDFLEVLSALATELGGPTLNLYFEVYGKLGREVHSRVSLSVIQCVHVMGVFLLLHEFGHVGLDHWMPPSIQHLTEEEKIRLRSQELAADEFAARCILRAMQGCPVPWDDVREMHTLFILILLLSLETHCRVCNLDVPDYYPGFFQRRQSLIRSLRATPRLEASIDELAGRFSLAKSTRACS